MTEAAERLLIVNADDFGRSAAVNGGIIEAFQQGILTSASLVAMGAEFDQAVELARQNPGLGIGIHLVLNEHDPALPAAEIPSLVGSDGKFRSRGQQFVKMAADPRMRDDAFREWDAQIKKVLAAGIKLEHIDGHGHCHAHPRVAGVVVELAKRYGIEHVRLPVEAVGWKSERPSAARFASKLLLNSFALCSKRVWDGKLRFPQSFYGFSEGGHVSGALVRRVGQAARPGVSELMVHVGNSNIEPVGLFTGYDWQGDLVAVTAFNRAAFEKEFGVQLITHTGRRN
jgi:hopanoid biosynthesis associated protein HpnK